MKYMTRANEKMLPDWEELDAKYHYEPETGKLFTKHMENGKLVLKPLTTTSNSIRVNSIDGTFPITRVIWKLYYQDDPPCNVRHLNGDKCDNRIANLGNTKKMILYEVRKALADKDYIPKNVHRHKWKGTYEVSCSAGGVRRYNGHFKCRTCAIFALRELADRINY